MYAIVIEGYVQFWTDAPRRRGTVSPADDSRLRLGAAERARRCFANPQLSPPRAVQFDAVHDR